jgi:NAD(P)-dependent dehydrogenase (short-subunit alcohol dehydrogenase family)
MDLQGKIAVVTGASSGIGEASARALAADGVTVVAVARRAERLEALADASAGQIVAHPADVTDDEAVRGLAKAVEDRFGACHVLVNNAGVSRRQHLRDPEDLDDLLEVLDVNLVGAARCMVAFADLLEASAPARVINVASVAGKVGVGSPAYAASKFGLVGLSEAARPDWERRGVAVCQLNPGFVQTEGFPQDHLRRTPIGRLVIGPDEVAEAVVAVARSGERERTVPRWYRGITVVRHVAAPAFWAGAKRMT